MHTARFQIEVVFPRYLYEVNHMRTEEFSLVLREKQEAHKVKKQCKMCGKVTVFTDTAIRRHNANGKNIFQFAIYKCPKNHSWNKKLDMYKSFSEHVELASLAETKPDPGKNEEKIFLSRLTGLSCEISIAAVEGNFRLDRTLADYIEGWSRSEIAQKIKIGDILLNNIITKPSQKLSVHDKIFITVK